MNERSSETTDAVSRTKADPNRSLREDALVEEIERLRSVLIPFANAARKSVVQDAISFGNNAPKLYLSRAGSIEMIDPWAFIRALEMS